ncbi:MAG: hypothetical protein MR609_07085 [Bacteroidales bacterium]|nr:hypothetical protein [Bacteroidales bacterium]
MKCPVASPGCRPLRGLNPGLLPCDAYGISCPYGATAPYESHTDTIYEPHTNSIRMPDKQPNNALLMRQPRGMYYLPFGSL